MKPVVVIAFYIWLALSVAMLFARLARRFSSSSQTSEASPNASSRVAAPAPAAEAAPSATPTESVPAAAAAEPAAPGGGRVNLGQLVEREAPPPTKTLAELLAGINVPNDLTPILPEGGVIDPAAASLITSAAADEVGKGVADELERLGYDLEVTGTAEMLARRGEDFLSVSLDLTPDRPDDAGRRRFPTATRGDVVVDLWVGAGPRP